MSTALIVGLICGGAGALYGAIAMGAGIYGLRFLSVLGFVLDVSWSLINSVGGLVWMLVCAIAGAGWIDPNDDSQRSGTAVYRNNPRGGNYDKTTIGPIIAGGWCSHEEVHVWQARILGPAYFITYVLAWLFNLLFRLITGKLASISEEAYYRIPLEDWAYCAGTTSGGAINWGMWFLWLFLTAVYVGLIVAIVLGIALKSLVVGIVGAAGLIVYSLIRALAPRPSHH